MRTTKDERRDDAGSHVDPETIGSLIGDLASKDGHVRESARIALVAIGPPAVGPLIKLLADRNLQVRWEAAKALSEIADPAAAPALVRALEDEEFSIRWLAAEGLIALRWKGLAPLLRALVKRSDSASLLQGAHHVLHDLRRRGIVRKEMVQPLLAALEDVDASLEVPLAARAALEALAGARGARGGRGRKLDTVARTFSTDEARAVGNELGVDWSQVDIEQFRMGLEVELEHGRRDPETDVTHDDPITTGKIALAHLREIPDYYSRLDRMEKEAEGKI